MAKRLLSVEEIRASSKAVQRMTEEIEYRKYLISHADLMLTQGLKQNYLKKMKEFQNVKRDCNEEISEMTLQIRKLNSQIREGVTDVVEEERTEEESEDGG